MFDFLKYDVIGMLTPAEKRYQESIRRAKEKRNETIEKIYEKIILEKAAEMGIDKNLKCGVYSFVVFNIFDKNGNVDNYLQKEWFWNQWTRKVDTSNQPFKELYSNDMKDLWIEWTQKNCHKIAKNVCTEYDKKLYIAWAKASDPTLAAILISQEEQNKILKEKLGIEEKDYFADIHFNFY